MLRRIIERDRAIEARSSFRGVPGAEQRHTSEAVPNHQRSCRPLFLSKRQELRGKFADSVAVERYKICCPEAVQDGVQQQRIFRRFAKRFSLCNQLPCPLSGHLGFWRGIPIDMDERSYHCDLKLDLLSA